MLYLKNFKLCCCLLLTAALFLYLKTLNYNFIWDDFNYVVNSPILGSGTNFFDIWTKKVTVDFWPVTYSFFWLLRYFFNTNPIPYHLASIAIYCAIVILLFILLRNLKIKNAFLIAFIFCIHPMNVSSVSWIFQIKTGLANMFGLLSCISLLNYFKFEKKLTYILSLVFFILSCLSKISLVMLPFTFLIYIILNQGLTKKILMRILPFFAIAFALGIANLLWEQNLTPTPPSEIVLDPSILFRFLLAGKNFAFYFSQTFLPINLMFVHPRVSPDINSFTSYIPALTMLILLSFSIYLIARRKFNSYFSGYLFSFLFLIPVLGFTEIYFMRFSYVAEHYLTLGMLGFLIPTIIFLNKYKSGKVVVFIYIFFLGFQTLNYIPKYLNEETVFLANAKENPDDFLQYAVLGLYYKNIGNFEKAFYNFNLSILAHPNAGSYYNTASLHEKLNHLDLARHNYEKAIELNPYISDSYANLGLVYLKLKNFKVGMDYLKKGLQISPESPAINYNIGFAYEDNKNLEEAKKWYQKALELNPTSPLFIEAVKSVSH